MNIKKYLKIPILILSFALVISSCGGTAETEKSPDASPSLSKTMTDAEKQAAEYEKIAQEALDNEHEHVWIFSHFQERHPHNAEYKCECGATKLDGDEHAEFKMTIVGSSKDHPHYMIEECSICKQHFVNENLPSKLTWYLNGYQKEHPHYAIIKCSQCNYTYIEYNTTAQSQGECKLESTKAQDEHPHYLIIECTFEGCGYTYVDKNITAEFELESDADNYEIAHPHFIHASCSYDGCSYSERSNEIADWEWDDGVCSICGQAKDVLYKTDEDNATVTGTVTEGFTGHLHIPQAIEGKPVESIGAEAFFEKTMMTSVHIPDSVVIIGRSAFENCLSLQFEPFDICPSCGIAPGIRTELECPVCGLFDTDPYSGHPVGNIGRNVMIVEKSAFRNCSALQTLIFGENLMEIQDMAFAGCQNLTRVCFTSMIAPMIEPGTFEGVSPEIKIVVPVGSVGFDAPEWEMFTIIYTEFLNIN